jgi:hypothetical protein
MKFWIVFNWQADVLFRSLQMLTRAQGREKHLTAVSGLHSDLAPANTMDKVGFFGVVCVKVFCCGCPLALRIRTVK